MINENFFRNFLEYVELNLLASIRESITLLEAGDRVRISTTETGSNSILYFDGRREVSDQLMIEVFFLESSDDEGFLITFDLFYHEDRVEVESHIFKGASGDATVQKIIINSHRIAVKYDSLENFDLRLDDYCEVALLLLKEYLFDRGNNSRA